MERVTLKLAYTSIAVNNGAHGTCTIISGVATYTPGSTYTGVDSFTFTATGPGGTSTAGTVSLSVSGPGTGGGGGGGGGGGHIGRELDGGL